MCRVPLSVDGNHTPFIRVQDGKAYILQGGLWVLDLEDPERPTVIAYRLTEAIVLDVVEDRVYLLGPGAQLEVVVLSETP